MQNGKRKTFFTLLGLLVLVGSLTGCFDDLGSPVYEGEPKLQFFDDSLANPREITVFEGAEVPPIRVQLIAASGTLDESHQFGVTAVNSLTTVENYEILTPNPTMEAGEVFSEVQVDLQEGTIPPGESETLVLELQPSEDGVLGVAQNFRFFGITILGERANVTAAPSPLSFGETVVGNADTDTVFVYNNCGSGSCTGTLPSQISDLQLVGSSDGAFEIVSSEAFTLSPADSQAVVVEFAPEAFQTYTDTLSFQGTNDADQSSFAVPLTGTGISDSTDTSFDSFDADESGELEEGEVDEALRQSGLFDAFDADGNAAVDSTEFTEGLFGAFDADDDEVLDADEFAAGAGAFFGDDVSATFEDFDADGDQAVTLEEFGSGYEASGADVFARFDADDDGSVTQDEFFAGAFGAADPDDSGGVTPGEFDTFAPLLGF